VHSVPDAPRCEYHDVELDDEGKCSVCEYEEDRLQAAAEEGRPRAIAILRARRSAKLRGEW